MNYTTSDNWHYVCDEGYYFKKDSIISKEIYLGKLDSIDNWTVITEEEKTELESSKEQTEE